MKDTVLKIVQNTLAEMGSDTVNSIDDTVESQRVASLLEDVYYELMDSRTWKQHKKLVNLDSSGDNNYPNYLKLPEGVQETYWLRYDMRKAGETRAQWRSLEFLYPDQFVQQVNQRNNDQDTVDDIIDWDGTQLLILNNKAPQYWTSFDDTWIVTDSWDSAVDTTLQSTKSQAYVLMDSNLVLVDDFVVDLPTDAFSLLKVTLKNRAFVSIKQAPNHLLAIEEQRQRNRMSRSSWKAHGGIRYPDYGRSRGRSATNPTFKQDRN